MNFLCYITVVETSLTKKSGEKEKKRTNTGKNNRRRPILNPTIELVIVNMYTKYEFSILNCFGDITDEKMLQNHGRMDRRTDGHKNRCCPVYPPPHTHFFNAFKGL